MKIGFGYPFVAVVGADAVKKALLCALVNHRLPSVLVAGPRGTAKTVLLRGLTALAPERRMILLPLNATEDRVFGGIDFERTMVQGKKAIHKGLLAEADRGVLITDDFHLLRDEITQGLFQTMSSGCNRLEREGVSEQQDARFLLAAATTPEEAELTETMLDRFSLAAGCQSASDPAVRSEITRRRLAFEENGQAFWREWNPATEALRQQITIARRLLERVIVPEAMVQLAVEKVMQAGGCAGHRSEIYLAEAARALAALAHRECVLPEDIEEAAHYVLWRRAPDEPLTGNPPPEIGRDDQTPEGQPGGDQRPTAPPDHESAPMRQGESGGKPSETDADEPSARQNDDDVANVGRILPFKLQFPNDNSKRKISSGCGKRNRTRTDKNQGRYVRASSSSNCETNDLAIDATLRAAAPAQKGRGRTSGCALVLNKADFRQKIREKRTGTTFVFVVDASGSMGSRQRISAVKGAIISLLLDAYQKRDRVALIAFRRQTADLLLPVTRSIELANRCLAALPTGGRTPLSAGIQRGGELLRQILHQDASADPVLIVITDGRANQVTNGDPVGQAVAAAKQVSSLGCRTLVLDTESDWPRLGATQMLAAELGAVYRTLDDISSGNIIRLVRTL